MASQRPETKDELLAFLFDGNDPAAIIKACDAQLKSPICRHTGTQGRSAVAFRCRTCSVEEGCIICDDCFCNGDHEGHDAFPIEMNGLFTCDCGTDMLRRDGWCRNHGKPFNGDVTALLPPAAAGLPARMEQAIRWLGEAFIGSDDDAFEGVLDVLVDVTKCYLLFRVMIDVMNRPVPAEWPSRFRATEPAVNYHLFFLESITLEPGAPIPFLMLLMQTYKEHDHIDVDPKRVFELMTAMVGEPVDNIDVSTSVLFFWLRQWSVDAFFDGPFDAILDGIASLLGATEAAINGSWNTDTKSESGSDSDSDSDADSDSDSNLSRLAGLEVRTRFAASLLKNLGSLERFDFTVTPAIVTHLFRFAAALSNVHPVFIVKGGPTPDYIPMDVLINTPTLAAVITRPPLDAYAACLPDVLAIVRAHLAAYLVDVPTVSVGGVDVHWRLPGVNQPVDTTSPLLDYLAQLLLAHDRAGVAYTVPEADARLIVEAALMTVAAQDIVGNDRNSPSCEDYVQETVQPTIATTSFYGEHSSFRLIRQMLAFVPADWVVASLMVACGLFADAEHAAALDVSAVSPDDALTFLYDVEKVVRLPALPPAEPRGLSVVGHLVAAGYRAPREVKQMSLLTNVLTVYLQACTESGTLRPETVAALNPAYGGLIYVYGHDLLERLVYQKESPMADRYAFPALDATPQTAALLGAPAVWAVIGAGVAAAEAGEQDFRIPAALLVVADAKCAGALPACADGLLRRLGAAIGTKRIKVRGIVMDSDTLPASLLDAIRNPDGAITDDAAPAKADEAAASPATANEPAPAPAKSDARPSEKPAASPSPATSTPDASVQTRGVKGSLIQSRIDSLFASIK